jgi:hypothetical protein
VTARLVVNFDGFSETLAHDFAKQIPAMTIKNGVAKTNKAGTYYIHYPGEPKKLFAVIDTAKAKYKGFATNQAAIYLAANGFYTKTKPKEVTFHKYEHYWPAKLSKQVVMQKFHEHHTRILVFAYIATFLFGFCVFCAFWFVYWFIVGTFGSIVSSGLAHKPSVRGLTALTAVAVYPVMFLACWLYTFNWLNYVVALLLIGLQLAYLIAAMVFIGDLKVIDEPQKKKAK